MTVGSAPSVAGTAVRFYTGANAKSPVTAKQIPTAERAGAIIENSLTPSSFLKESDIANIVIPRTTAVVRHAASNTIYGDDAAAILATNTLEERVNIARRI